MDCIQHGASFSLLSAFQCLSHSPIHTPMAEPFTHTHAHTPFTIHKPLIRGRPRSATEPQPPQIRFVKIHFFVRMCSQGWSHEFLSAQESAYMDQDALRSCFWHPRPRCRPSPPQPSGLFFSVSKAAQRNLLTFSKFL